MLLISYFKKKYVWLDFSQIWKKNHNSDKNKTLRKGKKLRTGRIFFPLKHHLKFSRFFCDCYAYPTDRLFSLHGSVLRYPSPFFPVPYMSFLWRGGERIIHSWWPDWVVGTPPSKVSLICGFVIHTTGSSRHNCDAISPPRWVVICLHPVELNN